MSQPHSLNIDPADPQAGDPSTPQPLVKRRTAYSVGTVTAILGMARPTVVKMLDSGAIPCFRLPIGVRERRVSHEALCNYICAHHELGIDLAVVFGPTWDQPITAADLDAQRPKYRTAEQRAIARSRAASTANVNATGESRAAS